MATDTIEAAAVSQREAARLIGISLSSLKSLTRSGELASLKISRRRLIRRSTIFAFLEAREGK